MNDLAIVTSGNGMPRTVRLVVGDDALHLVSIHGEEAISWWRLYRVGDEGTTQRFRRVDRAEWELRVTSAEDLGILGRVRRGSIFRFLRPLQRLQTIKVFAGIMILGITIAAHAPAEWGAAFVPAKLEQRLMDGIIAQNSPKRCSHEGGDAALRKLLVRLDPALGRTTQIVALTEPQFIVTAAPANTIVILHGAFMETSTDQLAALLAHQLSHLRHGDALTAAVRRNGLMQIWAAGLQGEGRDNLSMDYSGLEERRADIEAMQMLRRAGIPLAPAAEMYEHMRVAGAQHSGYAYEQRDFHFGIDGRAARWKEAARSDPQALKPALTQDEDDAVFNFCWAGRIMPAGRPSDVMPERVQPAGTGAIGGPTVPPQRSR